MKKSIACIAVNDDKVLIAHRNPQGQMGNRWEFPGGKVENDESECDAIIREMQEEFGIKVKVIQEIATGTFMHNGEKCFLKVYQIQVPHNGLKEKYVLTEHSEYKWISIDKIPKDNFVDSDLSIYPKVVKFLENQKGRK